MPSAGLGDRAFAMLQRLLPQHLLSRAVHRLARSTNATLRRTLIRGFLRAYPALDMREAAEPDPYAYRSFNEFFTRALRPGVRPIAEGDAVVVCPVDGTLSQAGISRDGKLVQAKGIDYTVEALLADAGASQRFGGGAYACIYLAPYNYHRIHMPFAGRLTALRYVPGQLFSVNAATARAIPNLFARNERAVCEFETSLGPMAMVLVGALFVGSLETVFTGEINPPPARTGGVKHLQSGLGTTLARGAELGRFNMGSTVVLLFGSDALRFTSGLHTGSPLRLGQALATRS
jgi:phosphatidylserine decarboxylase